MKLFENIKEFFYSGEEDYDDQPEVPSHHEKTSEPEAAPADSATERRNKVVN